MQGCDCFVWWHKVLDKEMSVPLPSVNWGIFETVGIFCPYLCWTEYTSCRLLNLRKLGHKVVTVAFLPGFTGVHDQHAVEWIAANMLTCETNPLVTSCSCFIWCDSLLALGTYWFLLVPTQLSLPMKPTCLPPPLTDIRPVWTHSTTVFLLSNSSPNVH